MIHIFPLKVTAPENILFPIPDEAVASSQATPVTVGVKVVGGIVVKEKVGVVENVVVGVQLAVGVLTRVEVKEKAVVEVAVGVKMGLGVRVKGKVGVWVAWGVGIKVPVGMIIDKGAKVGALIVGEQPHMRKHSTEADAANAKRFIKLLSIKNLKIVYHC